MSAGPAPGVVHEAASGILSPKAAHLNRAAVIFSFSAIWFVWGSTYLAIRDAVETIPPLYAAGFRHLIAGSVLFLWCLVKGKRPTWAQLRASIIIGAFFFLGGHGTLHWAEQRVPSGLAALLISTEPIFVFLLSELADRKWRINGPLVAGILLGLGGVAVLMKGSILASGPGMVIAAAAVLFGSFSWAVGVVYSRRSHLSGHPILLTALSSLSGSFQLLIVATIAGEGRHLSLAAVSNRSWLALAYLIILGSIVTFSAYNWLLEHLSATLVSTHTFINPIIAVLLGWLIAGEPITLNLGIAAAMVIAAVMLVDRGTARLRVTQGAV